MQLKKFNIKAVAAGLITDIVGSVAVGLALAILVAVVASIGGDASPNNLAVLRGNIYLRVIGLLGTTFFTGLGGYVAARMSRPNGISNSLAVGLLSVVLGIILAISAPGITPIWKLLIGLILTIPAALAGGKFATRASL